MIDLSGTQIAASEANGNPAVFRVLCYWDGVNATDETQYANNVVIAYSGKSPDGLLSLGRPSPLRAAIQLDNSTKRFSLFGGSLGSYIADGAWYGVKVEVELGFERDDGTPEYVKRFSGRVYGYEESYDEGIVTLRASDEPSFYMLDRQIFSPLYENYTTGQLIQQVINLLPADIRPQTGTVEQGNTIVPYAWFNGDNPLKELGDIAEIEGAFVTFTADGKVEFYEPGTLLGAPSVATIDIDYATQAAIQYEFSSTATKAKVGYRQPRLVYTHELWTLREPVIIPPYGSATTIAEFEPSTDHGIKKYGVYTIGGVDITGSVPYTVRYSAQRAVVEFTNTTAKTAVVWELQISGRYVRFDDERCVVAVMRDGEVVYEDYDDELNDASQLKTVEIVGNWYVQDEEIARRLAALKLYRAGNPTTTFAVQRYGGRFWYEAGDVVDVSVNGYSVPSVISSMSIMANYRTILVDVEAYPLSVFVPYSGNIFVIGQNAIGDGSRYYA